jgi:hypothetical protein
VSLEVERFEWTPGALELAGRWPAPKRFRHVRLLVDGRRIAPARQEHGEIWAATFPWDGDEPPGAPLLEVGRDLLVELPVPNRVLVLAAPARPQDPLAEAGAALAAEREQLRADRKALARERKALKSEQKALASQRATLEKERQSLTADRERLGKEQQSLNADRERLGKEQQSLTADRERLGKDRDSLQAGEKELAARAEAAAVAEARPPAPVVAPAPRARRPLPPRQPDDPVRGQAPLAVRIIAIALCSGVLVMLGIILGAIL